VTICTLQFGYKRGLRLEYCILIQCRILCNTFVIMLYEFDGYVGYKQQCDIPRNATV
jgi:hypothetical protein